MKEIYHEKYATDEWNIQEGRQQRGPCNTEFEQHPKERALFYEKFISPPTTENTQ